MFGSIVTKFRRKRQFAVPFSQLIAALSVLFVAPAAEATETPFTIEALVRDKRVEGMPLAWSSSKMFLLKRDGAMIEFNPTEAKDYHKSAATFSSYSPAVMRGMLEREFGSSLEVTGTGHFLVVHPKGQQKWAEGFEQMYRSCIMYFKVRGFTLTDPEFPLVAIVFANQDDFRRYALSEGAPAGAGLLGYYSPKTNRVALYDIGAGRANSAAAGINLDTITHEAAHQTAFNTGIHIRWSPPPKWVAEGLGTMFEARGVNDSRSYPSLKDRINRDRLNDFRQSLPQRKPVAILELINSDRKFDNDTINAYAEAWAFTFFLVETMPREYARYLQKTASYPPFAGSPIAAQRLKDFTDVFGENLALLDAKFLRFIGDLK